MIICILGSLEELEYYTFQKLKDHKIFFFDKKNIDITNIEESYNILKNIKPQVILHTAEYKDIIKCEKNPDLAYKINVIATENIVKIAEKIKSKLIYISSHYVFDGEKGSPYNENEIPNPINQYGKTKYAAELFIQQHMNNYYIIRIGTLFGHKGNNFIKSTLNLVKSNSIIKVVNDQITSMVYTMDLSNAIIKLINDNYDYGIYHLINEGYCSWFELTQEIFKIKNMKIKILPISFLEVQEKVLKPKNSSLNNNSYIKLRFWQEALQEYLII